MSGIAGIFHLDGEPANAAALHGMMQAIGHRGRGGYAHRLLRNVGLGHLRSASEAQNDCQPMSDESGRLCLTFEGRLDNRMELRTAIEARGHQIHTDTDEELVLRAYDCWGEECVKRLLGDFAFALWDSRARQLFCARDHMGVKPFYYVASHNLFAFGSEVRALLALPCVPRRLNESRIVDYLVTQLDREDKQSTFFDGVLRLPAGHCLRVTPDGLHLWDYWQLQPPATLKLRSLEEYGEAFREVFVAAIRCRLRGASTVGSTLSGGIDSSSVVCTIRELLASDLPTPLHTLSLVDADRNRCAETPHIEEVLRGGKLRAHIVSSNRVAAYSEKAAWAIRNSDEPFDMAQFFCSWFTFDVAAEENVRVLLDGVDGDQIIPHACYIATLIRGGQLHCVFNELSYMARCWGQSRFRSLLTYGLFPMMPRFARSARHLIRPNSVLTTTLIDPEFALRMDVRRRCEARLAELWDNALDPARLHASSFTSGLLPFVFETFSRMASRAGVETRHPFADRRVVEFFLSLPLRLKVYTPWPKLVIRAGMKGILPESVRWRTQFGHPGGAFLATLFRQHANLVRVAFEENLNTLRQYVNVPRLLAEYNQALAGCQESYWDVWQIANLALWLNAHGARF